MIAPRHILGTFDEALTSLRNNVLMMAGLTERSLQRAIEGWRGNFAAVPAGGLRSEKRGFGHEAVIQS